LHRHPNLSPLEHIAARVADDPYFFGSVLATYQRRHGLDDTALAALEARRRKQEGPTPTGIEGVGLGSRSPEPYSPASPVESAMYRPKEEVLMRNR
jgi:hypothetical protein